MGDSQLDLFGAEVRFDPVCRGDGGSVARRVVAAPQAIEPRSSGGVEITAGTVAAPQAVGPCSSGGYDLGDAGFVAHAVRLGGLYQFVRPGSARWVYLVDCSLGVEDWLGDVGVRFAQEHEGKRHRYEDDPLRAQWEAVLVQRVKLQRCWDDFTTK